MRAEHAVPPAAGPGRAAPLRPGPARPSAHLSSFRRIVDIPFAACVAAVENGRLTAHDGGRHARQPLVCGPVEHDRDSGTCRIQLRLGRGPLRPPLRMRLHIDYWSCSPPRTVLELIPCGPVWPTAAYFRAGHLLLDWLTGALAPARPTPRPGRVTASQ